jgi:hypothetical protein
VAGFGEFDGGIGVRVVEVRGARAIEAQFAEFPKGARDELRKGLNKLTGDLANRVRAAGRASSRQAARAATTVRASRGTRPRVAAGPHPFLFLSEFGMDRRTGWYSARRYFHSPGRQARPHVAPGGSYWFFRTLDTEGPRVAAEAREIADAVVRHWNA